MLQEEEISMLQEEATPLRVQVGSHCQLGGCLTLSCLASFPGHLCVPASRFEVARLHARMGRLHL